MGSQADSGAEEIRNLRRRINDLASLIALPAIWRGRDAYYIARTLMDALLRVLSIDFVYLRLAEVPTAEHHELIRVNGRHPKLDPEQLTPKPSQWLSGDSSQWPRFMKNPFGDDKLFLFSMRLGLSGEYGAIVAAADRPSFPDDGETLVLNLAANQVAIGLEQARRLSGAEMALSASRHELAVIVDTIPALVWSTRPDGSVEYMNQHYLDYVGMTAEQTQNWGWTAAVHPEDVDALVASWRSIVASGKSGETEARFRRADGRYRWLLARANPLRDGDGHVVRWYGLNTDIEERKQAEIRLAGERQVLEMIASARSLPEVLAELCRLFERSASECLCSICPIDWRSRTFELAVAPSLPRAYVDRIAGASVDSGLSPCGLSIRERTEVICEDIGLDPRWIETPCRARLLQQGLKAVWSKPIFSQTGSVVGTVCVYRTSAGRPSSDHQEFMAHIAGLACIAIERSQAIAALRRSEAFLAEGQRLSATGSFLWRVEADERYFSEELYRIFELQTEAEATVEQIATRIHPDDLSVLTEKIAQVRAGQNIPAHEFRLQTPRGGLKYLRVLGRTIENGEKTLEYLGAVQDITQLRLAEQARDKVRSELAHVSKIVSLGALTASIAHEINQPLASIVTNGETALRLTNSPQPKLETIRDVTRRVVSDARRAAGIIERIRATASRGAISRSSVAWNEVVAESLALLQHELHVSGVSVAFDPARHAAMVWADRTQLQQVIVNLVVNAMQAMETSGARQKRISIRCELENSETVRLSVEDSGPGVKEDHLPRLFDSFFTTKETGMGLGLQIVRTIVEEHGGRIRAEARSALGGARFDIDLPAYAELKE